MERPMTRYAARLTLAALAMLALAGIPLGGSWMAAPAVLFLSLAAGLPVHRRDGRWGLASSAIGLLGGGVGIATAVLAVAERGAETPYNTRIGFVGVALLFAALALAGGGLLPSRPRLAIGILFLGSPAGCLAMAFFTVDTWYFISLPLCWLAAALAVVRSVASTGASRGAA